MHAQRWLCGLLALIMVLALLPHASSAADGGPALASGNYEKWIDRIANLPDYARRFYSWLEENADASGALADPSRAAKVSGTYVHRVHTLKGTAEFAYSAGADLDELALDAALAHAGDTPSIAMNYIFDVYGAFDRDHPEVFWLGTESVCGMGIDYQYTSGNGTAEVDYELSIYFYLKSADFDVRIEGYRDPALIAAGIQKRDQDIQRILSNCPRSGSVEEQIRYLNQVLIETNAYNSAVGIGDSGAAAASAWKCVSALAGSAGNEGPVCEGYSRAFKVLCDELGIPCVLNEGYARSSASSAPEAHMWNYVQVDGSWYAVDVTWNDPVVSSKPDAVISGKEREKWLLLGSGSEISDGFTFIESHPVRNEVNSGGTRYTNGPELARDAYGAQQEPVKPDPTVPDPTVTTPTVPDPTVPDTTVPDPTVPGQEPEYYLNVEPYRGGEIYTAPEKDGCVFAGWYTDPEMTQPLGEDVTTGCAYARFVDARLLSAKCQITEGTTAASAQTDLRLLTGVCGLDYLYVTFQVSYDGVSAGVICDRGYEQLTADGKTVSAADVFGIEAAYFMSYTLSDVPRDQFEKPITVTPCWCTPDGTLVTGTTRIVSICSGF